MLWSGGVGLRKSDPSPTLHLQRLFLTRDATQSAVTRLHVVCLSVMSAQETSMSDMFLVQVS